MTDLSSLQVAGVPTMGMGGSPFFTGRWIFANAVTGSDGNTGAADNPVQTLTQAYSLATEGKNDVIVLMQAPTTAASTTGTFRLSSTLTWAKSATHLIGMTAPTRWAQRARISTATGATTNVSPLIDVTAQGCYFGNFSTFQGVGQASTDEQLWLEEGQRNYYWNVQFGGLGSVAGAARAGSYNLKLYGAAECTFDRCTIGLDTRDRTAANANVLVRKNASNTAVTRIMFENCLFPMFSTSGGPFFVDSNQSGSMDRGIIYKDCVFMNDIASTGVATAAGFSTHASQGGMHLVFNPITIGMTNYSATNPDVNVKVMGPVPNGFTSGKALSSATS